jgi:hypothetical protein
MPCSARQANAIELGSCLRGQSINNLGQLRRSGIAAFLPAELDSSRQMPQTGIQFRKILTATPSGGELFHLAVLLQNPV